MLIILAIQIVLYKQQHKSLFIYIFNLYSPFITLHNLLHYHLHNLPYHLHNLPYHLHNLLVFISTHTQYHSQSLQEMKNDIQIKTYDNESDKLNQLYIENRRQINCIQNNPSEFACFNSCCNQYPFICFDQQCQCKKVHKDCIYISSKSLLNFFLSKAVSLKEFSQKICQKIDQTINTLSQFRQDLQTKIKSQFLFFGLSQSECSLISLLQKGQVNNITGKLLWQTHQKLKKQKDIENKINQFEKSNLKIWSKCESQVGKYTLQIKQNLSNLKGYSTYNLFEDSKLLTSQTLKQNLNQFFNDQTILQSKLLFRASEHDFDTNKFHEKCDNITDTLTICQTQFGKVIGGYTPLIWTKSNDTSMDDSGKSFIFSLTSNHKFEISKGKTAVYRYSTIGPTFGTGSPDFYINNRANTSNSQANPNQSYSNSNYKCNDQESWQKFSGSSNSMYFKIKEWQVWKLSLSDK